MAFAWIGHSNCRIGMPSTSANIWHHTSEFAPPPDDDQLIEGLAEKAIKLLRHPPRVQCNTFQEGTDHVLTGMLQREIQQASPQTRVVNRAPFPEQPGGIKQTSCSRGNGCRNFVQNGIGIGWPLRAESILMEEELVAEESEIGASRRLHSNRQIAPGYRARHRCDLRTHICFFEGNMRLDPGGCSDIKMSLAIPNCSRPNCCRGIVDTAGHHERLSGEP